MKKITILSLILALSLAFTACGSKQLNATENDIAKKLISEYKALNELPEDYLPDMAESNGDVVSVHGRGRNVEKLNAFLEKLKKKEPAMIRVTQYTVEGDAMIKDIIYDGQTILLKDDNTRDNWAAAENKKVIQYKVKDIIVSKANDGTNYDAKLENGDTLPITWINSK